MRWIRAFTARLLARNSGWSRDDAERLIAVQAAIPPPSGHLIDMLANTGEREDFCQRVRAQHVAYRDLWS